MVFDIEGGEDVIDVRKILRKRVYEESELNQADMEKHLKATELR